MKKNLFLVVLLFVSTFITSCGDDDTNNNNGVEGSAAEIVTFVFDSSKGENAIVTGQPIINNETKMVSFTVLNSATDAEIKALIPTVTVSLGATVNPKSGVAADFAVSDTVKYVVTSQDATSKVEYGVTCSRAIANIGEELNNIFYKGELSIELDGINVAKGIAQKIFITKTGENMIKMELKNFSFSGMTIGDIVVDSIAVVKTGDNHTLKGAQDIILPISPCSVSVEGTINGDVMDIEISITKVPGFKLILVDFKGEMMMVNQSSEAKITAFTFEDQIVTGQPVINGTDITFIIPDDATPEQIKSLIPTITISEKATISPASGVATDFTNGVKYTVTSEDGIYQTVYTVVIGGRSMSTVYTFDEWMNKSFITVKYEEVLPSDVFGSSNLGAAFLSLYGFKGGVNVIKEETDVVSVNAAKLVTLDASSIANKLVPGIISGSLFLGSFDVTFATTNRLECTRFGIPYTNKPLRFKGNYKYTAGSVFIDASDHAAIVPVDGKKDECSIAAILFEVESDTDVLTGVDVNTSDRRVAVAVLADGTDKAEYTSFDIPFTYLEGKSFDPSKKYKITFVCSSSKEGDFFKGAPNSTLLIDQFEIISENVSVVE